MYVPIRVRGRRASSVRYPTTPYAPMSIHCCEDRWREFRPAYRPELSSSDAIFFFSPSPPQQSPPNRIRPGENRQDVPRSRHRSKRSPPGGSPPQCRGLRLQPHLGLISRRQNNREKKVASLLE